MRLYELVSTGSVADAIGCADIDEAEIVYTAAGKHRMPLFWFEGYPYEEFLIRRDADRLIRRYRKPAVIVAFPAKELRP